MSPDERVVAGTFARATRRARAMAVAEAVAWGLVAGAIALPAAPVVVIVLLAWRLRSATTSAVVRALERTNRDGRNLFVTAHELLTGALEAKDDVRQRVFTRAASVSSAADLRAAVPLTALVRAFVAAVAAWLVVWTLPLWRPAGQPGGPLASTSASSARSADSGTVHVTVTLTPPAYTNLPAASSVDPPQIGAVEGTEVTLLVDARAGRITVEHDGDTRTLTPDAAGRFTDRFPLRKTGYCAVDTGAGGRRVIPIVVSPDALPAVKVTAPARDLVYPVGDRRVDFEVRATDDFGLRALALEYTKVSGSGEQFEFKEGRIPLVLAKATDRDWRGTASSSLASLELAEGDMLVYRAVAADARPGDGTARSDAFFIEISKLAAAAGDGFTVPEEETRYALSQQMLIVKTERLEQKRAAMAADALADAALNLAVEQRMIRAEFVFMLGGEIEDEDVEAAQSTELQEGRLQNRGQRDLRAATVAMSQAEKLLTGASTREALVAERAAVAALQRAFTRDRYILRALGSRTELDLKRRLTGSLDGAAGGRRPRPTAVPNRRAMLLQDLLAGIGALRLETGRADARARAIELAREALIIDPNSAALRQTAASLQRVADTWSSATPDARTSSLADAASVVAAEAARALASPASPGSSVSPGLAGSFADALRAGAPK